MERAGAGSHDAPTARRAAASRPRRRASACSRPPRGCSPSAASTARRSRRSREAADVSPETVYATSATSARCSASSCGARCAAATTRRCRSRRARSRSPRVTDRHEQLRLFAGDIVLRLERVGPLLEVLATAARSGCRARRAARAHPRRATREPRRVRRGAGRQRLAAAGAGGRARHRLGARQPRAPPPADRHRAPGRGSATATGSPGASARSCSDPSDGLGRPLEASHLQPRGPEAAPLVEADRRGVRRDRADHLVVHPGGGEPFVDRVEQRRPEPARGRPRRRRAA